MAQHAGPNEITRRDAWVTAQCLVRTQFESKYYIGSGASRNDAIVGLKWQECSIFATCYEYAITAVAYSPGFAMLLHTVMMPSRCSLPLPSSSLANSISDSHDSTAADLTLPAR